MSRTIVVPLKTPPPQVREPSYLELLSNPSEHLARISDIIDNATDVIVVCGKLYVGVPSKPTAHVDSRIPGAGISTAAGISDFRSPGGVFANLKRQYSRAPFSSGKDLFHMSALRSKDCFAPFCKMMGDLAHQSQYADPTPFHYLMQYLDTSGKLRRVYTQNVDCLEQKCGISFGVPPPLQSSSTRRSLKRKYLAAADAGLPRCIPLHGRIDTAHCMKCGRSFEVGRRIIDTLLAGSLPACDDCLELDELREVMGERSRGIGNLLPDVILYDQQHPFGEVIGSLIEHDLGLIRHSSRHKGSVLLLVAGTSLRIPDVKSIIRRFSKAIRDKGTNTISKQAAIDSESFQSIFLNFEFPLARRDLEGVFDAWICGDIQGFSAMMLARLQSYASKPDTNLSLCDGASSVATSPNVIDTSHMALNSDRREPDGCAGTTVRYEVLFHQEFVVGSCISKNQVIIEAGDTCSV
jgi:NAD-dependent SIR2 family protein deacetylase